MTNILKEFYDTEYPNHGFSNFRVSVRGIIKKDGKIGLLKIESDDIFGKRNHFEICGGGIETNENRITALKREVMEETGITISTPLYLGSIIDRWNLLSRINMHHYYICEYSLIEPFILNSNEIAIKGVEWKSIDEFIEILNQTTYKINKMIHQRELVVLKQLKKSLIF